jgi:putative heme-binding domain-containing protein
VTLGPDGAIYVSDWHDARTAHPDPDAEWDRSNGRVYRIASKGTVRAKPIDFAKLSADELVKLHQHRSQWYVRRARQELVRRKVAHDSFESRHFREVALTSSDEIAALEALWSLNLLGGFGETIATQLLGSPHAAVRAWTVRLLGDRKQVSTELAHRLDDFAEQEPDISVRQQLACCAARLPAHQALPIINANINRDLDLDDPYIPLLWWWAVEKHSAENVAFRSAKGRATAETASIPSNASGREEVLRRFVRPTLWKSRLGRDVLLTRLIRRYAAERTKDGIDSVVRLLKAAPTDTARAALWPHVLIGWNEQPRDGDVEAWREQVRQHEFSQRVLAEWKAMPSNVVLQQLGIALRLPEPMAETTREAFDEKTSESRQVQLLELLNGAGDAGLIAPSLVLLDSDRPISVRIAALHVLAQFNDASITPRLIATHRLSKSDKLNAQICDVLLSRSTSARTWLNAVDRGEIAASSTSLEQVRRVALFAEPELDRLVTKHWGKLQGSTRGEKLAEVRRLNNDLRAASGNPTVGQQLFKKHCAACHQLFGEGQKVGPDLTTANRMDRDFLLISLVDPSSVIRKEFVSVIIQTTTGRVLTGLPIARDDASITLVDSKGERQIVANKEIDELHESPTSLMPEDLYRQLKPQELRDLFSYLQK